MAKTKAKSKAKRVYSRKSRKSKKTQKRKRSSRLRGGQKYGEIVKYGQKFIGAVRPGMEKEAYDLMAALGRTAASHAQERLGTYAAPPPPVYVAPLPQRAASNYGRWTNSQYGSYGRLPQYGSYRGYEQVTVPPNTDFRPVDMDVSF